MEVYNVETCWNNVTIDKFEIVFQSGYGLSYSKIYFIAKISKFKMFSDDINICEEL